MSTQQPTITISIVCSPEQLADVQARVSALQADLYRLGVAFSVSTHHELPPRSSMTLDEAQHDQEAFLRASSRRSTRSTSIRSWRAEEPCCRQAGSREQPRPSAPAEPNMHACTCQGSRPVPVVG